MRKLRKGMLLQKIRLLFSSSSKKLKPGEDIRGIIRNPYKLLAECFLMGVYDGAQFLRNRKATLLVCPLSMKARILDYSSTNKEDIRIEINEELSIEEQVKSLIHEILHCSNHYINYLPMRRLPEGGYNRIEKEIDFLTEQIYVCQPVLTEWLRKKLKR